MDDVITIELHGILSCTIFLIYSACQFFVYIAPELYYEQVLKLIKMI